MPSFFTDFWEKVTSYWSKRTTAQRMLIAGLAVAVIVAFILMLYWLNRPNYKVLYADLFPEDANRVVQMLEQKKVPYKLANNGKTVMVPADQVYKLRLNIAGQGNLHGQGVGFELFDQIKIGQTDFVQRINYQRALQGELARTINDFPQVERSRVHLVIPSKSLFIEEQMEPSASVVLMLKKGQKLDKEQIKGIVNLVSMAVEGLKPERITVADTKGEVLYKPDEEGSVMGMTSGQLEYKTQMQHKLERRITELLLPVVGPDNVITRVNTELDFSQKTIKRVTFDPDGQVVRSEQTSTESTDSQANIDGQVPEPNFRGDGFTGSLTNQKSNRETETVNYEINKETQEVLVPVGELQRMSVAVIVDGTYEVDEKTGESTFVPRSEEEIQKIRELVKNAVGLDETRGDSIEVSTISFGPPDIYGEQGLLQTIMEYMQRLGKPFLNGILIFLFLILVVRPVVMALIRPRVAEQEVEEMTGLPEAEERLALAEAEIDEETLDAARRLENAKAQAMQLSEKNMDQAVMILKNWLKQEAA
jgi:flagellar M-ring protein FliF